MLRPADRSDGRAHRRSLRRIPGDHTVLIGEDYLYGSGVTRSVTDVYLQPDWRVGGFSDTDLALPALDAPVTDLPTIPFNTTGDWPELGQTLAALGWGQYYEGGPPSSFLQYAAVWATSGMDGAYDDLYCDLLPGEMTVGGEFCFGGPTEPGVNICSGDSG